MVKLSNLFFKVSRDKLPQAVAQIKGNQDYPKLSGWVKFYQVPWRGIVVEAEIMGLPSATSDEERGFFAMHIHQFGDCTLPFDKVGTHYNPTDQPHPYHSGDLLPLLNNDGYAWSAFYDNRFTIEEIIGRAVIIHLHRDDFTSQPSGDAGEMIGCGEIKRTKMAAY